MTKADPSPVDASVPMLCAIDCLRDLGMDRSEIDDRIAVLLERAGYPPNWKLLAPENRVRLGAKLQAFFEAEFKAKLENEVDF